MNKLLKNLHTLIDYKISIKELYFSLSSWLLVFITFLAFTTKFNTTFLLANLLIGLFLFLILILIINRIILSGFITLLLAVSFDYIKAIKWQFLMQDFSAADFFMLKLLVNHGLFRLIYEYANAQIYFIILLLIFNFMLLWNRSDTLLEKRDIGGRAYYSLRILSIFVALLMSTKIFDMAQDKKSYFSLAVRDIKSKGEIYPQKIYGPFASVLFTLPDIYIEPRIGSENENYIISKIKKEQFPITNKKEEMPDIVVILNESTFDPSKLDYDFADNLKYTFFQDNKYTKYSGILNVNTFGGSSWISEYEINTGIPHKSFSGPSYMPFITLTPHTNNSIMKHLKEIGYNVEVVYPVDKNFSLAQEAYTSFGADNITDIYEYGFKPKSWGNIPDTMISKMILDKIEENPDQPKYIFASTMLNHGPHSSYRPDKLGCSLILNDKLCSKLNDYITRLDKTNIDQNDLIKKLMNRKRKTIIVNFGDHLPSFEGLSTQLRFTRDISDFYKTFYNIHANFPINEDNIYDNLDIYHIPGLVLDMAKLNNNEFYQASSIIRKSCKGQTKNCGANDPELQKLTESYNSLTTKQLEF